jgi:hypothetical protein
MPIEPAPQLDLIVQRDDGQYQLGWQDDAPAFPSRAFASAVAARAAGRPREARIRTARATAARRRSRR